MTEDLSTSDAIGFNVWTLGCAEPNAGAPIQFAKISIAEVLAYDSALSTADIKKVTSYLKGKYGF